MADRRQAAQDAFINQKGYIEETSDLQMYIDMIDSLNEAEGLSEEFKKGFVKLYKLRRNEDFRKVYFDLLQNYDSGFKEQNRADALRLIIEELQKAPGNVELSFATKLMATADDSVPIWDSYVEAVIKQWYPKEFAAASKQKGIDAAIAKFSLLEGFYEELEANGEAQAYVEVFDQQFPNSGISDAKKIDYVLWAYGKQLLEDQKARKSERS